MATAAKKQTVERRATRRSTTEKPPAAPAAKKAAVDPREGGTPDPVQLAQHGLAPKPPTDDGEGELRKRRTQKADPLVSVTVPQGFTLTVSHSETVRYEAGIQDIPRSHAEHVYAIANGVEINE